MKFKFKFRQCFDTANMAAVVETAPELTYQEYCNFTSLPNIVIHFFHFIDENYPFE